VRALASLEGLLGRVHDYAKSHVVEKAEGLAVHFLARHISGHHAAVITQQRQGKQNILH
jgi:hypothetical protein